jgi:hypothetical protein
VAGPDVERHTMGVALRDGTLLVYVDSPVWANELSVMAEQYRQRLNEVLGKELVRAIRFTVSRKVGEEKRRIAHEEAVEAFYEPDETPSAPLSDQERAQVEHVAAEIDDEELRETVIKAITGHLERKKGTQLQNGRENGFQ